ncbi:hypothetical protein Sru01_15600 [Sphaerisporangium rufum]|uniref:Excreted virulence factor EspC, type VII ESX diderm n=1 Tax=Sphaerisporangium rufum TaxID=1381558 RepID=A0A919QZC2_9ACTN|nr:hypothetical protein [Sphaerisporangium rufum]GII76578.1 hypothetical protein Sru01_15600 [Sphaerisporangium rufum]
MSGHIDVTPRRLRAAAAACTAAGEALVCTDDLFRWNAAPTARCFGLVEGASDELAGHYRDFHTEVGDFLGALSSGLETAATVLAAAADRIERTEELTADAVRRSGGR